jgi:trehalose 6-phosphate synthase/phosphatase
MRNLPKHLMESGKVQAGLIQAYQAAAQRALLLDYDGTLVPFVEDPKLARPDTELMDLLRGLGAGAGNEVMIASGRPRRDLEEWFGELPVSLVAEHGVWLRPRGGEWRMLRAMTADWKERVRPILQVYVNRLPGALLEEKEFSLAWHYRGADPEQASRRSRELLNALAGFTRNIDVHVLEGNKVLEVRNTGVNKGTAATEWLGAVRAEFVLAIGDDWTDEDLFRALPATAYSVRVGLAQTAARYYLNSHTAVRRLLEELIEEPGAREDRAANGGSNSAGGVKKNGEAPVSSSKVAAKVAGKRSLVGLLAGFTSEAVNWVMKG